jgi:hypothetical protein
LAASGTWADKTAFHHIVVIYSVIGDGTHGKMELYFDNVSKGVKTYINDAPVLFNIGARTGMVNSWDGIIDEVGLWSKVLTSAEVAELYASGAGKTYPF